MLKRSIVLSIAVFALTAPAMAQTVETPADVAAGTSEPTAGADDPAAVPDDVTGAVPDGGADVLPAPAQYTIQTPIRDLIADSKAKAVLDKDLPGMSDDPNLAKFQDMSLKQLQPQTGGQLTEQLMIKVAADLAKIKAPAGTAR